MSRTNRSNRNITRASISLALGLITLSAPAVANPFTPQGASNWLARNERLIEVLHDLNDTAKAADAFDRLYRLCDGNAPYSDIDKTKMWAVMGHSNVCVALKSMGGHARGKSIGLSVNPCTNLDGAVKELEKANPAKDPANVVAGAGELKTLVAGLRDQLKAAKECKFAKPSLF